MQRILRFLDELANGRPALQATPRRAPARNPTFEIAFDGETYVIRVKRHSQARRYTLRINAATREAMLTMPTRGSLRDAKTFAQQHGAWIAARLHRLPDAVPFADGVVVPLRGEPHRIVHCQGRRGTVWVEAADTGAMQLCVAGDARHLPRRVADFLKREAQRDLEAASQRAAATLGVTIKRITLRDQTSRWGSCSSRGVLSYSWRLVFAPPFVLDYLACHEVAHLVEMNHSARFWRLVQRLCPRMEQAKTWLDVHGPDLHRYGAPADA